MARGVARRVDGFWDAAEGRMVPEPLRHHERGADGRFTQYLLADPHLPDDEADPSVEAAAPEGVGPAPEGEGPEGEEPRA